MNVSPSALVSGFKSELLAACVLAGVIFASVPAMAANINWTGGNGGDWGTGSNWNSGSVPTSADLAVFAGNEGAYVNDARTVSRVNLGSDVSGDSFLTIKGGLKKIIG